MKLRFFVTFFSLIIALCVNAQMTTCFIRAGVNLANVKVANDGATDEVKSLTSFQVGLIINVPITPYIAFQPGLVGTGKGTKSQLGNTSDDNYYRATSNPYYIEIPANLVFKSGSSGYTRFFAGAGPYLGIGVAGKVKSDGKVLGTSFHSEKNIEWSNDDPSTLNYEEGTAFGIIKRFDYGLNGTAGIETRSAVISINYGFGLAQLQSGGKSSDNAKNKNRVLSFTVGIRL